MTATEDPVVRITDLVKEFPVRGHGKGKKTLRAVDGVSLEIGRGETVGLVGESGSGKTTVGRTLIRLYRPTSGGLEFEGGDITSARGARLRGLVRRRMAMVFQNPSTSLNPYLRVRDVLTEPLQVHRIGDAAERRATVDRMLDRVGLDPAMGDRYPQELSGGQRQRVGIARALMLDPSLVVADEPTASLDVSVQAQIVNLMQDLQEELGLAYLFITHDLSLVRHISHRVAVMYLGRLVELAPTAELFDTPLHPYSAALASMQREPEHRVVPVGDIPSPIDRPTGCVFRSRCPVATEQCARTPPLAEARPGRFVACHHPGRLALGGDGGTLRTAPARVPLVPRPTTAASVKEG
ncbi:ABC transporter ATP-binding protein [Streptomyces sp. NBC_01754]|uniref:ABC transporter ATP-binding protein n=1 Tax=Streptomyces sp. NBC_01754 TaxID=2975930 RepID=UPI002DDA6222|nr:ABC transporter ATP-binding protein [Streptomyces sp. NBC_01754]WSC91828.1 ABC transporter ATP-binding protein [Streptomyces sp. NBC_01754]